MTEDEKDVLAELEAQFERDGEEDEHADTLDIINFRDLSDYELSCRYNDYRDRLLEMHEMDALNPTSEEARELHSLRAAAILEQRRRAEERKGGGA